MPELRELDLLREFHDAHGRVPRCNQVMREKADAADVAARRRAQP